jgi:Fuc2NAc and GlcNAc transferase
MYGVVRVDFLLALTGAGGLVAVTGFLDDHGHVPMRWRLFMHFIAAFWVLYWLGSVPSLQFFGYDFEMGWMSYVLAAVLLVWLLNMFNFMDGIDGLAGSEAIFIAVGGALFSWLSGQEDHALIMLLLVMASLGFLYWNWSPAKIFMGDVGSGFLGITIGALAYKSSVDGVTLWAWLILMGVFLVDAGLTLLRRFFRGERWYEAHCSHAYQWSAKKWGHMKTAIVINLVNIVWLFPLAYVAHIFPNFGFVITLVAMTPLLIVAYIFGAGSLEG